MASKGKKSVNGSDSKFFTTNRKGENHELREELRSPQRDRFVLSFARQIVYSDISIN